MLDHLGRTVIVGWSRKEELYLEAIIEMGCQPAHLKEMSELTGRSRGSIYARMRIRISELRLLKAQENYKASLNVPELRYVTQIGAKSHVRVAPRVL